MVLIPSNIIMRLCVSAYAYAYALVKTSHNTGMQSKRALVAG